MPNWSVLGYRSVLGTDQCWSQISAGHTSVLVTDQCWSQISAQGCQSCGSGASGLHQHLGPLGAGRAAKAGPSPASLQGGQRCTGPGVLAVHRGWCLGSAQGLVSWHGYGCCSCCHEAAAVCAAEQQAVLCSRKEGRCLLAAGTTFVDRTWWKCHGPKQLLLTTCSDVHCTALQRCCVLHCTALHCSGAVCYTALHCTAAMCAALHCSRDSSDRLEGTTRLPGRYTRAGTPDFFLLFVCGQRVERMETTHSTPPTGTAGAGAHGGTCYG
jgi:hypothetical protein